MKCSQITSLQAQIDILQAQIKIQDLPDSEARWKAELEAARKEVNDLKLKKGEFQRQLKDLHSQNYNFTQVTDELAFMQYSRASNELQLPRVTQFQFFIGTNLAKTNQYRADLTVWFKFRMFALIPTYYHGAPSRSS